MTAIQELKRRLDERRRLNECVADNDEDAIVRLMAQGRADAYAAVLTDVEQIFKSEEVLCPKRTEARVVSIMRGARVT